MIRSVQEKQELAKVFGEEAFKAVGDLAASERKKALEDAAKHPKDSPAYNEAMARADSWNEGGVNKILLHTVAGGIMSDLGGSGFTSGAVSSGVNEAIQGQLSKIKDPALHQWASALVGAAAAGAVGGNAHTGASTAASGTKNNWLTHTQQVEMANSLKEALDTGNMLKANQILAYYANLSQKNRADNPGVYDPEAIESRANEGAGLQEQLQRFSTTTNQTMSDGGLNYNLANLSNPSMVSASNNNSTLKTPSSLVYTPTTDDSNLTQGNKVGQTNQNQGIQTQNQSTQQSSDNKSASYSYFQQRVTDNTTLGLVEVKANGLGKLEDGKIIGQVGVEGALVHATGTTGKIGNDIVNVTGNIDGKVGAFELGAFTRFDPAKGASIGGVAEAYAIKGEYGTAFQMLGSSFSVKYTAIGLGVGFKGELIALPGRKLKFQVEGAVGLGGGISIESEKNP